jgi:hypothetical protein
MDQGVAILVMADVADKETALLRFNCFDFERSYVYGPENADLRAEGPAMLGGRGHDESLPDGLDRRRQPDRLDDPHLGDEAAEKGWGARAIRRLPSSSTWRR